MEVRQQRLDVQLRQLEFHALLHRKLDLELLFECLFSEGQGFVAFDGLFFRAADRGCDVHLGSTRQYTQHFELKLGERSLGEVILMRGRPFTAREERDSEKVVESLVYPLDNALEHHEALLRTMTDAATGLGNGAALALQLPRELRLARRCSQPLTLLRVTVDRLESIGEHHGVKVEAQAWHSVAGALSARLRRSDLIFRTGEDAFCIVLGDTSLEGASILAHRLRHEVDRCVTHGNVQFVLTTSLGSDRGRCERYRREPDGARGGGVERGPPRRSRSGVHARRPRRAGGRPHRRLSVRDTTRRAVRPPSSHRTSEPPPHDFFRVYFAARRRRASSGEHDVPFV